MIFYYVYLTGNKITHAEVCDMEILSENYICLYHGKEETMPDFLPKGVITANGGFIYSLIDGKIVERSAEEIAADEEAANPSVAEDTQEQRIAELEAALEMILNGVVE